jgi:uncharacterized membrane protein HdeD (DUF308 family)
MAARTLFLARFIGLYCIVCGLAEMIHRQATLDAVRALLGNPSMVLWMGMIAVLAGLAMVLGHNLWRGGALTVVVTLVGWISLLKGVLLLFLPAQSHQDLFFSAFRYEQLFYLYAAIALVLGLYLTYAGFRSKVK